MHYCWSPPSLANGITQPGSTEPPLNIISGVTRFEDKMVAIEVALGSADSTVGESEPRAMPAAAEIPVDDLPITRDIKAVFQGGTFLLLLLGGLYFAAEIVLPIVLACMLML